MEDHHIGKGALAGLEFLGPRTEEPAIADGERVAVDLVDGGDFGQRLLIGADKLLPVQAARAGRFIKLQLSLNLEVQALRGLDRSANAPTLDLDHDVDLVTGTSLCRPPALETVKIPVPGHSLVGRVDIQAKKNQQNRHRYFHVLNLSPCREAIPFTGATVVLAGFPIRPVAKKSELQSCCEKSNFSISPGNRLSTGEQRPPLMSRRCLRRPLSRDPDAVIVGAVHRCSNAPPGVIENLPGSSHVCHLDLSPNILQGYGENSGVAPRNSGRASGLMKAFFPQRFSLNSTQILDITQIA